MTRKAQRDTGGTEPVALAAAAFCEAAKDLAEALAPPDSEMRDGVFSIKVRSARVCAERGLGYLTLCEGDNK